MSKVNKMQSTSQYMGNSPYQMTMLNQQSFSIPAQQAQVIKEHLLAMQTS